MLHRLVLVLVLVSAVGFTEAVELGFFGTCAVATVQDDFTDEVQHHFIGCAIDDFSLALACYEDNVGISHGILFSVDGVYLVDDQKVTIKYRFDKEKPFVGEGIAFNNLGRLLGRTRFDEILDGIATAETLVFQLDDETRRFPLSGAEGAAAVAELRSRCPA